MVFLGEKEMFDSVYRLILFEISLHPTLDEADLCKLVFQASYGADHILGNRKMFLDDLLGEFSSIDSKANGNFPLIQSIDPQNRVYRLHLAPLKRSGQDAMSVLNSLYRQELRNGDENYFKELMKALKKVVTEKFDRFDAGIIESFSEEKNVFRHSEDYGFASYRVINDISDKVFLILKHMYQKGG